jgi:hypothetical protein
MLFLSKSCGLVHFANLQSSKGDFVHLAKAPEIRTKSRADKVIFHYRGRLDGYPAALN